MRDMRDERYERGEDRERFENGNSGSREEGRRLPHKEEEGSKEERRGGGEGSKKGEERGGGGEGIGGYKETVKRACHLVCREGRGYPPKSGSPEAEYYHKFTPTPFSPSRI